DQPMGCTSGEYWAMGATLTQQRRVKEEGLRIVNLCQQGRTVTVLISSELTVPAKEASANSVPAAAVIRRLRALFGITGRKGRVGGMSSQG
ncbi:hypothetical protein BS624_23880, partial [Vibrio parahaemolyticus]